jgi:hypothetical protein
MTATKRTREHMRMCMYICVQYLHDGKKEKEEWDKERNTKSTHEEKKNE